MHVTGKQFMKNTMQKLQNQDEAVKLKEEESKLMPDVRFCHM